MKREKTKKAHYLKRRGGRLFRVTWEIDEYASSPKEAVRRAVKHYDDLMNGPEVGSDFGVDDPLTPACLHFAVKRVANKVRIVPRRENG